MASEPEQIHFLTESLKQTRYQQETDTNLDNRDAIMVQLAKQLILNVNVPKLDLSNQQLTDTQVMLLFEHLLANNNDPITHLILDNNLITDEGVQTIANFLKKQNTRLKVLSLAENTISDKGIGHIAEALKENTCLEVLNLDFNKIGSKGAIALSTVLSNPSSKLLLLSLNSNLIGLEGLQAISTQIKNNSVIIDLEIESNEFDKRPTGFLSDISSALEAIRSYTPLIIRDTLEAFDAYSSFTPYNIASELTEMNEHLKKNQKNIKEATLVFLKKLNDLINLDSKIIQAKTIQIYHQECEDCHLEVKERIRKLNLAYKTRTKDDLFKEDIKIIRVITKGLETLKKTYEEKIVLLTKVFSSNNNHSEKMADESSSAEKFSNLINDNLFQMKISFEIKMDDLTLGNSIGEGTFGTVYQGTYLESPVAIKKLNKKNTTHDALFKEEFKIMANLRGPHIITLYGLTEAPDGQLMIVMEYMNGGSLYDLLITQKETKTLDWLDRYRLTMQTVLGLHFLHENNTLHRDLKAENVMLTGSPPIAKLIDFGLAAEIKMDTEVKDVLAGTPLNLAPEILIDFLNHKTITYNKKTDTYAFGILLYEIIMRDIPYKDFKSIPNFSKYITNPKNRASVPADTPPSFTDTLFFCWHGDPAKRYTAKAILDKMREQKTVVEIKEKIIATNQ